MNIKTDIRKLLVKHRTEILCVAGGFALYALISLVAPDLDAAYIDRIDRKGYGEDTDVNVVIEGLTEEELTLSIPVSGRRFSDSEIGDAFDRCMEEVTENMTASGENIKEVYSDLNLPSSMNDYGFKLVWVSCDPEVVSSSGEIFNTQLDGPADAELIVSLSDGERSADYSVAVTVMPEKLDKTQRLIKDFLGFLKAEDSQHQNDASLMLPSDFNGRKLRYKSTDRTNFGFIWVLGIALAVFFYVRRKEKKKEELNFKQKQVSIDYPELVSRMMVFTGAGMTIRLTISAIAADARKSGADSRFAYAALCRADARLKTGMSESMVYRDFGRECGTRQYMKLAGLLEQNRKSGVAGMNAILRLEMTEAWEERKNLARRQGEEASTRLLMPLLLMLGIVLVMVMLPALMSF